MAALLRSYCITKVLKSPVTVFFTHSSRYFCTKLSNYAYSSGLLCHGRAALGVKLCKRLKSDDPNPGSKQNVTLVLTPGPIRWLSNKIKLFLVHSFFDQDFNEEKFLVGAKQAICTVSSLACRLKFSELEGLLTDEAIETLKDDLDNMNNTRSYEVSMTDVLHANIHDFGFQYDETEKGKKWLHVLVSYLCNSKKDAPRKEFGNITFIRIPVPNIIRYSFRKECTNGVDDAWIITKIIHLSKEK